MYCNQETAVKVETMTGKHQRIKQRVRQGRILSPGLFSMYSENIIWKIRNKPGIPIGGRLSMNNVR